MLKSRHCVLNDLDADGLTLKHECPHDPGGYFVIRGVEKVALMQEQLSKNRIIIEKDAAGTLQANVTSSTDDKKVRGCASRD
jgi:DNA-directed RNA polymerase III subunit RPC2